VAIVQPRKEEGWLQAARASGIGELVWFANGVEQDRQAVAAAFDNEWSQGQVEGQVNQLDCSSEGCMAGEVRPAQSASLTSSDNIEKLEQSVRKGY
jgi:hypothetical protein